MSTNPPIAVKTPKVTPRNFFIRAGTVVVTLIGELDLGSFALLDTVLPALPGEGAEHVIVFAERLSFCDVAGFRR
jgi:anti-anti-sigma regulatory factor